jgi:hypothetical protein
MRTVVNDRMMKVDKEMDFIRKMELDVTRGSIKTSERCFLKGWHSCITCAASILVI